MMLFRDEEINLLEAAQDGKLEFIQNQLANQPSNVLREACKKIDYYGRNALHYAAYRGHYEVLEFLLNLNCINVQTKDHRGNTALLLACIRGYNSNEDIDNLLLGGTYEMCKLLIQRGDKIENYVVQGKQNPTHWSCYYGDLKTTKMFIEMAPTLMLMRNEVGRFPIDYTLMRRKTLMNIEADKQVAEYLIIKFLVHFLGNQFYKARLDEFNIEDSVVMVSNLPNDKLCDYRNMGQRYLFWASVIGRIDLVSSLLEYGFSPFKQSYKGRNSVHAATYNGHIELLKLFFSSEVVARENRPIAELANIMTKEEPQTALHIAIQRHAVENHDIVTLLIQYQSDLSIYNYRNHRAFDCSRSKVVRAMLNNNQKDLFRSGYKYVLVGNAGIQTHNNLLLQQLNNIKSKYPLIENGLTKSKFKMFTLNSIDMKYIYYVIKVDDRLLNEKAEAEELQVYNVRDQVLCPFKQSKKEIFENFNNLHTQQIILNLMYDEFDLDQFMVDDLLVEHFPLHDSEEKQLINKFWKQEKWDILLEPLKFKRNRTRTNSCIQSYFGAEVGFFFVFLNFFTSWLFMPSLPGVLIGIYQYVTDNQSSSYVPIYTLLLSVWATIFFEFWKRKQNETAFLFDMHTVTEQKNLLPSYKGQFLIDDVTHTIETQDKRNPTLKYMKSVGPLIIFGIALIGGEFVGYYMILKYCSTELFFRYCYAVGYAIVITMTNDVFSYFARLTLLYENHQYEDERDNVYLLKVFTFNFFNCFSRLFYSSLIDPNAEELSILTISFTITWGLQHFARYTLYPIMRYKLQDYVFERNFNRFKKGNWRNIFTVSVETDSRKTNKKIENSNNTLDFIKELESNRMMVDGPNHVEQFTFFIIQFSIVTMFTANSLLMPLFILLMNILNLEGLIYSYLTFVKRPICTSKKSIGLWNDILQTVGYIATVINTLTIYTANQSQLDGLIGGSSSDFGGVRNFVFLIAAEHVVIGIKFLIEQVIPDEPEWVEKMQSRQAHLLERLMENEEDELINTKKKSD